MPRPTNKQELITAANQQFEKLWVLIDTLPGQNPQFNFADLANKKEAHWDRDQNLRDVLVHLYEWHQLLLSWVAANTKGEAKPFLPGPYTWKTYGEMNVGFWQTHQNTPYEKAVELLKKSHADVIAMLTPFTNEQLFDKGQYKWTGTTTLGSYCVSATSSHYDWAMKKVKAHIKLNI